MVARQQKNTRHRAMDGTLYMANMPQFLRNYKLVLKLFHVDKYRHYVC